jgi:AraC family transcriptional regulator of adaptative response/methylated-DNA-[protein]-cysteine methyltransferase
MTPSRYRAGGDGVVIEHAAARCFLGWVFVGKTARGICTIEFGDEPATLAVRLQERFPKARIEPGGSELSAIMEKVVALIETPADGLDLPLDIQGTAFQQRVWKAIREIPAGMTASYGELARRIGRQSAVRAVAQACAANTLAVAIPCHRVVRSDGALGGYRWHVERKRALLERERGDRLTNKVK